MKRPPIRRKKPQRGTLSTSERRGIVSSARACRGKLRYERVARSMGIDLDRVAAELESLEAQLAAHGIVLGQTPAHVMIPPRSSDR